MTRPDLFPYRSRPGCSSCGDQEPAMLSYTPVVYSDPTGYPDPDTFKNVSLCNVCKDSRPTWRETFSVTRVYHTVLDDAGITTEDLADEAAQQLADAATRAGPYGSYGGFSPPVVRVLLPKYI